MDVSDVEPRIFARRLVLPGGDGGNQLLKLAVEPIRELRTHDSDLGLG
jgi:hypothetical protein